MLTAVIGTVLCLGAMRPVTAQQAVEEVRGQSALEFALSGEDLRNWGVIRFGDALKLSPFFTGYSVDGFRTHGSLFGAGLAGGAHFRVILDGAEVHADFVDGLHSEMLPVPTSRIARMVIRPPGPGPTGIASSGWVIIETVPAASGPLVTLAASAGNEVGDPGPFRYTDRSTPNVDRDGPSADLETVLPVSGLLPGVLRRGQAKEATLHLRAGVRADQAHLTEAGILDRVYVLYDGVRKPRMTLIQPRLGLDWIRGENQHRVRWSQTNLRDLPFLEVMGSELPISRQQQTIQAFGVERRRGLRFGYSISVFRAEMAERANRDQLDLGWTRTRSRLRATVASIDREWLVGLSLLGQKLDVDGFSPSLRPVPKLDARWDRQLDSGIHRTVSGQMVLGRYPGLRLLPGAYLNLESNRTVWEWSLRLGFVAESPESTGPEALWLAGGWDYPGVGASRSTTADAASDIRSATLDASLGRSFGAPSGEPDNPAMTVHLQAFVRGHHGLNAPDAVFQPDSLFLARYLAQRTFGEGVRGQTFGLRASGSQSIGPGVTHRLDYTITRKRSSDDAFIQAASFLPEVQIRYTVNAEPYPRTFFGLIARFQSETVWEQYRVDGGDQPVRLPARAVVDATFSKQFAGSVLRVHLALKNLTRGRVPAHPVAPSQDLTFVAGIRASL